MSGEAACLFGVCRCGQTGLYVFSQRNGQRGGRGWGIGAEVGGGAAGEWAGSKGNQGLLPLTGLHLDGLGAALFVT